MSLRPSVRVKLTQFSKQVIVGRTPLISRDRFMPYNVNHVQEYSIFTKQHLVDLSTLKSLLELVPRTTRCNRFDNNASKARWLVNPWVQNSRSVSQGKHPVPKIPSTKIMRHYDIHGSITNEDSAKQFVYALSSNERKLLLTELDKYRDVEERRKDATKPSRQQLIQVFSHQVPPFIGFGFLDNLLMIVAGEYIDSKLACFGFSTMAAAALGNLISDVCGIGSASYVETLVTRLGIGPPQLTPEQVDMPTTRFSSLMGKVIGVTIGCLLGMFPLLFFNKKKVDENDCDEVDFSAKQESKQ